MNKAILGRTGLAVTKLSYGAMEIRGPRVWSGRPVEDADAALILNSVLDAGINMIDTSYDYGRSEEFIGRFISHRRSEFILATKCGCCVTDRGVHDETSHIWTQDQLLHNIDTSLRRLKTDYVDILQLHGPTVQQAEEGELVDVLKEIQASGKARYIGVSSYLPNLPAFVDWRSFDTFQLPYSALERDHENWITKAADTGAGIIVRGGVGQGEPGAGRGSTDRWSAWEQAKLDDLLEHGEQRTGFLLRFTLSHPSMATTIVGTKNPAHLAENLRYAKRGPLPSDIYEEAKKRLNAVGRSAVATT
ncbi:aldo/keto reductase [Paenibacillus glycanilyticus]|uniref:Aldo/keto reductase n=1 Tax=Paenibacillus glycanilyticus TaxID=126569 RepID=A0ABQ6G6P4_9BACL|nr:aldo/keto reductase [Paenibacillus glycanilyticus]GLX66644.1 aldo/keto reductase [Paenibacillus glycanilyticus]